MDMEILAMLFSRRSRRLKAPLIRTQETTFGNEESSLRSVDDVHFHRRCTVQLPVHRELCASRS